MSMTPKDIEADTAEAEAATWFARLQSEPLTDAELGALELWLATPVNRTALDRAEALWSALDDVADLGPASVVQLPPSHRRVRGPPRWPWAAGLAIAASIAGVVVLRSGIGPEPAPTVYESARGRNQQIALEDGTQVHLGGGSKLIVRFRRGERRVELASADGEAAFDVVKDSARPFVIYAGDRSVRVVGTEFDVRRAAGRLVVTVRRGVVEVAALAPGSRPVRLMPGQEFSHKEGDPEAHVAAVDPGVAFGWTEGERTYREQALPEVVADLNRYFSTPLQVDPAAADLKFTGFLKIDEEDAVVRRLQAFLPITVQRTDQAIILRREPG